MHRSSMKIAICVVTYRRPEGLRKLLASLITQEGVDGEFGIVVVDNDPDGSAREIVDEFSQHSPDIVYQIEPEPGIPAARNRSIALARSSAASTVAFIDDDEFATQYWLATMYQRMQATGADAISGPVEPIFPDDAPAWAIQTRLYNRATFLDGARLDYASTANSMLRLNAIAGMQEPFRRDFQFTGGSDTFLYQSIRADGKTIIWEPAALVYENVPSSRLTLRWIVARGFRQGITLGRCVRLVAPKRIKTVLRAIRGAAQIPIGLAECALSLARNDPNWRSGLVRIARGSGVIAGLTGITYEEYRRTDTESAWSETEPR